MPSASMSWSTSSRSDSSQGTMDFARRGIHGRACQCSRAPPRFHGPNARKMRSNMTTTHPADALVFFGATGDLAYKKIFPALQALVARHGLDIPIIGVARSAWGRDRLLSRARDSVRQHGVIDEAEFAKFASLLRYVDGDYREAATYARLCQALGAARRPLHYFAIPPSLFGAVAEGLANAGCTNGARVVIEKPFGRDARSARELDSILHRFFDES